MSLFKKISAFKHKLLKSKQERELKKFNQHQEELDNMYKKAKQKSEYKSLVHRLGFETYTKRLVGIITLVGLVDLQLTYVLAFLGKVQIAESLSNQICVTLLGTVLVYSIKSYFETKAEKRDEMIKAGCIINDKASVVSNDVIKNTVENVINNSGLSKHVNTSTLIPENPEDSNISG